MEEKNLRKKVIKYTVVLALISAVIIGCSAIVVVAVRKAEERSYTAYVDSLVNEYRLRFEERMASAFETLQLMGELMEDGLLSKESIVTDQIQNLSENSSFFKLSYYDIRRRSSCSSFRAAIRSMSSATARRKRRRQFEERGKVRWRFLRYMNRMASR